MTFSIRGSDEEEEDEDEDEDEDDVAEEDDDEDEDEVAEEEAELEDEEEAFDDDELESLEEALPEELESLEEALPEEEAEMREVAEAELEAGASEERGEDCEVSEEAPFCSEESTELSKPKSILHEESESAIARKRSRLPIDPIRFFIDSSPFLVILKELLPK